MTQDTETKADVGLHAYTDESGNTGNNVFDEAQPWFWTGTLVHETAIEDPDAKRVLGDWNRRLGTEELHAADLGFGRLEPIAGEIGRFIDDRGLAFIFTRVEKQHVAALKFADLVLDSGNNPAVAPFHYWTRFFRLSLALALIQMLEARDRREFWDAYLRMDLELFRAVMERVFANVERVIPDPRVKQLLHDALRWGIANPRELMVTKATEMDAPNMVAFALVIDLLHQKAGDRPLRVARFVADAQNQFARSMQRMYDILRRYTIPLEPFSWAEIKEMKTFEAEIEILPSHSAVGLQIIDVVLWLMRRRVERSLSDDARACAKLVDSLAEQALISEFSFRRLVEEVGEAAEILRSRTLSPDDEERGRRLLAQVEELRRTRMGTES